MTALTGPEPLGSNPLKLIASDVRRERRAARTVGLPPGDTNFDWRRTQRFANDPLSVLTDLYARYGPVFTIRILHGANVFMLGPAANHYITVSHAKNFSWRDGFFRDLVPFLGDGLLTIDGDFHRRSRRIMLPAFHRERIAASHDTMVEETERAIDGWRDGERLDLNAWTRALALRIAMRALFGLDPDTSRADIDAAHEFERALSFHGRDYVLQIARGPGTPFAQMRDARAKLDRLIYAEIERRRRTGERGEDILSLLLDAEDEDGGTLSDHHIRDEVMTLLFAGHDTTTSTIDFMFYELARSEAEETRLVADLDAGGGDRLEHVLEETLRKYPPAWVGPRRANETFEFAGVTVGGGLPVSYSSWASHHLPDVWPNPDRFEPDRFAPGRREQIPKGAYIPFGGGSRTCIGMRFGEAEIRVIAKRILRDWRLELEPGYELRIQQTPTIGPRGALPFVLHRRTSRSGSGVVRPGAAVPVA
jgi:cytochrome P450